MKKVIMLVCSFITVMSISIFPALAYTIPSTRESIIDSFENNLYSRSPSNVEITGLERELFTFYPPNVETFVSSGPSFQTGNLPANSDIQYYGKLDAYHTTTDLTAGICTFRSSSGDYDIVHKTHFVSGKNGGSGLIPVSSFSTSKIYYGFVDGTYSGGTSGKITYIYFDYDYYSK